MTARTAETLPCQPTTDAVPRLSFIDRLLPLWIFAAMGLGIAIGKIFPGFGDALDRVQIAGVSLPIAIGLLWMMYPVLAKVRYDRLDTVTGDRSWLRKVRPFWGHDEHFHIRIGCQPGSGGCKEQSAPPAGDGCDKSLAWWFTEEPWRPNKNPDAPKARDLMKLSSLPKACVAVLNAPSPESEAVVTLGGQGVPQTSVASGPVDVPVIDTTQPPAAANAYSLTPDVGVPVPRPRAKVGGSNR